MPEQSSYSHGTPSWMDLATSNVDAAIKFYGELFGWEAGPGGDPDQTGGYREFRLRGRLVAGAMPVQNKSQPVAWMTHVSVDDIESVLEAVESAGGVVHMAPVDVLTEGRVAFFADKQGAMLGLWEPRDHKGADVVNEPGALAWNELATPDAEDAVGFYSNVFGWTHQENLMPGMAHPYYEWKRDDESVAGMMQLPDDAPEDTPPHWLAYFAVEDIDRTVGKVERLGGQIMRAVQEMEIGRYAVLADPQGAVFAVVQLNEPSTA